jgi:hypothetical protein
MMKKKGEKGKRTARSLENMTRFKTDPIFPASMSVQVTRRETSVHNPAFVSMRNPDLSRMKQTWSTIMKDMNKLASELQGQSPWLTKSVERLRSSTRQMNNDLLVYVEDSYGHVIKLQGLWMTRFSNLSQDLMDAIMSGKPLLMGRTKGNKGRSLEHRTV